MAGADYYRCDHCNGKAFYDANLDYNDAGFPGYVGDMKALCQECAKTHEVVVVAKAPQPITHKPDQCEHPISPDECCTSMATVSASTPWDGIMLLCVDCALRLEYRGHHCVPIYGASHD